ARRGSERVRRDDRPGAPLDDAPLDLEVLGLPADRLGILLELLARALELGGGRRLEKPDRGELERLGAAPAEVEGLLPREALLGQTPARVPGLDDDGRRHDLGPRLRAAGARGLQGQFRRRRGGRGHARAPDPPEPHRRAPRERSVGQSPGDGPAPRRPRRSGKRKPPYPNDLTATQASHTPTGPIGLCCAVGGCAGSNAASATRPNPATASARIPFTSLRQRSPPRLRSRRGLSSVERSVAIRPPG